MKWKRIKLIHRRKRIYQSKFSCIEQHFNSQQNQMLDSWNYSLKQQQRNKKKNEEFWKQSNNFIEKQVQFNFNTALTATEQKHQEELL